MNFKINKIILFLSLIVINSTIALADMYTPFVFRQWFMSIPLTILIIPIEAFVIYKMQKMFNFKRNFWYYIKALAIINIITTILGLGLIFFSIWSVFGLRLSLNLEEIYSLIIFFSLTFLIEWTMFCLYYRKKISKVFRRTLLPFLIANLITYLLLFSMNFAGNDFRFGKAPRPPSTCEVIRGVCSIEKPISTDEYYVQDPTKVCLDSKGKIIEEMKCFVKV